VITKKFTIKHTNNNLAKIKVVSVFFKDEDEIDDHQDHHDGDMVIGLQLMSLEGFG
jgi:hypothetical protein